MQPNPTEREFDWRMMRYALALAERGLGRCWPNPSVGCVLVKHGRVIGSARTADGGRPHAEPQALAQAGEEARGATAYVTLEPCAHHGQTPPCAESLVAAGIARVVIACTDPDSRVRGRGIALLKEKQIEVETGLLEAEAMAQHQGFFSRLGKNRPFIAMKLATSLDGRIANALGESQWITGDEARWHAHMLRARHDAILTGIGTVLADDPALTCRLPGLEAQSPVRVVLDSQLRLPVDGQLARTARQVPLWVLTTNDDKHKTAALEALGVQVAQVEAAGGHVCLHAATAWLAAQGITRLLCEGGAALNGSLWQSGLVDRLYWYRAPIVLGDGGTPALQATVDTAPSALPRLQREEVTTLGSDMLETYITTTS